MSRPGIVIEPLGRSHFLKAAVNGMRTVTVYVTDANGVPIARDRLDVEVDKACAQFTGKHVPASARSVAPGAFVRLSSKADGARAKLPKDHQEDATSPVTVDPAIAYEAAKALATLDDILTSVAATLQRMGVAGEAAQLNLIYLAVTSRLLHPPFRPVSAVIKGLSSAGKSYVTMTTLKLFPESALALSENSPPNMYFCLMLHHVSPG